MHIKFLQHGTGSCVDAADYLTQEKDYKGEIRKGHEVLTGDLYQVADVADSLDFVNRYSSAVVSFHPSDRPTAKQLDEVLFEFEKTAFAGLELDSYSWSAVRHDQTDGGCHLHIIVARVELNTGKHLNIAPPGWQKTFDPLRDYFNEKNGWVSPDIDAHPENARLVHPGHTAYKGIKAGLASGTEDPRQLITEHVMAAVSKGLIETRDDVVAYLEDSDLKVNRIGKNYITVIDPAIGGRGWRIKGVLFDGEFAAERAINAETKSRDGRASKPNQAVADIFFDELARARGKRAIYNKERYKQRPEEMDNRNESKLNHDLSNAGDYYGSLNSPTRPIPDIPGNEAEGFEKGDLYTLGGSEIFESERLWRTAVYSNRRDSKKIHERVQSAEAIKNKKQAFKQVLAGRMLNNDLPMFSDLKFVDTRASSITFNDDGQLIVNKQSLSAIDMSDELAAERIIQGAKAEQWKSIKLSGSDDFFKMAAQKAIEAGIEVKTETREQQDIIEDIYERQRIERVRAPVDAVIEKANRVNNRVERESAEPRERAADIDREFQSFADFVVSLRDDKIGAPKSPVYSCSDDLEPG